MVDEAAGALHNVVCFPPGGSFSVRGALSPGGGARTRFAFTGAALRWGRGAPLGLAGRELRLPPRGEGWYDTLYLDDELRLCRDVRGDLQVCRRRA